MLRCRTRRFVNASSTPPLYFVGRVSGLAVMGGYGVRADPATTPRAFVIVQRAGIATLAALAGAGFRRFATYRQATVAAAVTNSVFGFLRCSVLLATLAGSG